MAFRSGGWPPAGRLPKPGPQCSPDELKEFGRWVLPQSGLQLRTWSHVSLSRWPGSATSRLLTHRNWEVFKLFQATELVVTTTQWLASCSDLTHTRLDPVASHSPPASGSTSCDH